jgi:tetratricopeptide (TPR) repeat protein
MTANHKDIYALKVESEKISLNAHEEYIRFYENNIDSIDNIDISFSDDNYYTKLRLFSEYGVRLVCAGYFSKGANVLEKAVPMFENAPEQDYESLKDSSYFGNMLWSYGLALHESKQTDKAIEIFQRLLTYYPENEKYRNWFYGLKVNRASKYSRPFYIIGLVWLVCYFTIFKSLKIDSLLFVTLISGLFLLLMAIMEFRILFLKKKKVRPHNTK